MTSIEGEHCRVWLRRIALLLVLAGALFLRTWRLDQPLMWCDEAESTINALTILQHGYPTDSYLGLPIYENMLSQPWPEHPEYEFRDTSYSHKGMAVYHAWLPLYSIAGSLKLFGIEPDVESDVLRMTYTDAAMSRRTIAARAPSVIYGMGFVLAAFFLGREMFSERVGWVAMVGAAVANPIVHLSRQARYYSATVLFATLCCLMAWRIYRNGKWRDFILAGLVFAALFHTHILTFLIAGVMLVPVFLATLRRDGIFLKWVVFGGIVLAAAAPWVVLTGFLQVARDVPSAREMMQWSDFLMWPLSRWPVTLLLLSGPIVVGVALLLRHRLPTAWGEQILQWRVGIVYLAIWAIGAYVAFILLIPAASLSFQRAWLPGVGPGLVMGAALFSAFAVMLGQRTAIASAVGLFVAFLAVNVGMEYSWKRDRMKSEGMQQIFNIMREWDLNPGTRLYASPNDHLILTCYSGLPVQSIAPVRRSFLENYPGDIVYLECFPRLEPMDPQMVLDAAHESRVPMTTYQARQLARVLDVYSAAKQIQPMVQRVVPDPSDLPPIAQAAIRRLHEHTRYEFRHGGPQHPLGENPAVFRGFEFIDRASWWQTFFYRFVDPEARRHENVNYSRRFQTAKATVLPSTFVIYHAPAGAGETATAHVADRR